MKKFYASLAALIAVASAVLALNFGVNPSQAQEVWNERDCSTNAIIKCGTLTRNELTQKVNNSSELQALYAHLGISKSMINSGTVKSGLVYKNGNVTVGNDKIVATNAWSVGREYKAPNSEAFKVGNRTYYKRPTSNPHIFQNGLPQTAFIFFDANGKYVGTIIKGCGNPIFSKPKVEKPKPVVPTNPGVSIDKKVSSEQKKDSGMTKEEALEQARNYRPKTNCTTVMTPAIHIETGARYTFPSGCLPNGWVAERNYTGDEQSANQNQPTQWVEHTRVVAGQTFRYQLIVKNTGDVDLKDVKVSDEAPTGVEFVSTDKGTISNNSLNYTIATLKVGKSETIVITAKANANLSTDGRTKNTACVDTPTVPGQPDDCDDATIDTDKPTPTPPAPTPEKEKVCELKTGDVITIDKKDFDSKLHSMDLSECDDEEVLGEESPKPEAPKKKGETPEVIAATGPAAVIGGLFGSSALGLGITGYLRSRRAISDLLR